MKRHFLLMSVMAVAAISACTKQPIVDVQPYEPSSTSSYIYTVSASTLGTKSDYDAGGHFTWSAGDAISVLFHNGTTNKFFTLTTTGTGASATFSGTIDAGYEIGASDGTVGDQKIWALFPASDNHSYTAGEANPVSFYVQPSVDFSATYFSANVPMYALNDSEGSFTFTNLACTYKFTVKNIKAGVDKVQFQIHNKTTYGLSGSWTIKLDGSTQFINYGYADPGSAKSTLTYVSDVTSNEAVFYVSCRWYGTFEPEITVTNCATGVPIKTFTATKEITPNSFTNVQPIALDVSEANGGDYFTPAVVINGDFSDWSALPDIKGDLSGGGSNDKIALWKTTADARYIYVYLKQYTSTINNGSYVYVGFDTGAGGTDVANMTGVEQYVLVYYCVSGSDPYEYIHGADPRSKVNGSSDHTLQTWGVDGTGVDDGYSFIELSIPRSKVGLTAAGSVNMALSPNWSATSFQTLVLP